MEVPTEAAIATVNVRPAFPFDKYRTLEKGQEMTRTSVDVDFKAIAVTQAKTAVIISQIICCMHNLYCLS
ncbi:hypothetical protein [Rhodoferax antarcticus]|uniref:hypothetical protein n=1 Tax=Rhodoferax antarcticus TaxID=81479 RepID=UPI00222567CD|nr:hypothetical protein [Rhodoferax antarcticus]MCW2311429.1 hypothetical protein [Rhodoferax antarcticus]